VLREAESYVKDGDGLKPRPITRHLKWGIPLPVDDPDAQGKVIYVWFDAPIGYISSTIELFRSRGQEERWKEFWKPENPDYVRLVHFIGKDNIFFHAVMFPIMCHGQENGWKLVDTVPANAFLNLEGKQFSKSEGWYIDPLDFLDRHPADSARFYLCSVMPETRDTEFQWDDFGARHNELANVYGNIVHRVISFTGKNFGAIPKYEGEAADRADIELIEAAEASAAACATAIDSFQFRRALEAMMDIPRMAHKYIDTQAPWTALKENKTRAANIMHTCIRLVRGLAVTSFPFLPDTALKIWDMLGETEPLDKVPFHDAFATLPKTGFTLAQPQILFQRLTDKDMAAEKEKLQGFAQTKEKEAQKLEPLKPERGIKDFMKWDLRVGTILTAEAMPKSDKMVKLTVDIGVEQRTVMAGIGKSYKAADLPGRRVILVANLEPKTLMGVESRGMVLCATHGDKPLMLQPEGDPPNGARVS
jgi:methionyl-tRNA synthetase